MTIEERLEKLDAAIAKSYEIEEYVYEPFDDGDGCIKTIDYALDIIHATLEYYKDELLGNV